MLLLIIFAVEKLSEFILGFQKLITQLYISRDDFFFLDEQPHQIEEDRHFNRPPY